MPAIRNLFARDDLDAESEFDSKTTINMMIGALSLIFLGLVLATCLVYLRRVKQQRLANSTLPTYRDAARSQGLTIQTTDQNGRSSVLVFGKDGQPMLANPLSPPHSPDNVPQIRITFPDEADESGKAKNGRVVVVRMGDTTVGLEPLKEEEQLPAYEKDSNSHFYSVDMDQIGGLKEKDHTTYQ